MTNFTVTECGSVLIFVVEGAGLEKGQKISATLLIVLNIVTSLCATIGNGLVIFTLIRSKHLKGPTYVLMGTLSVLDFLVGTVLQPMWIAAVGTPVLKTTNVCGFFYWGFALLVPVLSSTGALSVLTLIALDRFISFVFQPKYSRLVTNRRAACSVGIVLLANMIISVTTYLDGKGTIYFIVTSVITWLSYSVMVICYCSILVVLWIRGRGFVTDPSMEITKTIALASFVCGLCWLPFNIAVPYVLNATNRRDPKSLLRQMYVYEWLGSMLLGNSSLNFGIYYWRNRAIRREIQSQAKMIWHYIRAPSSVAPGDIPVNPPRSRKSFLEETSSSLTTFHENVQQQR